MYTTLPTYQWLSNSIRVSLFIIDFFFLFISLIHAFYIYIFLPGQIVLLHVFLLAQYLRTPWNNTWHLLLQKPKFASRTELPTWKLICFYFLALPLTSRTVCSVYLRGDKDKTVIPTQDLYVHTAHPGMYTGEVNSSTLGIHISYLIHSPAWAKTCFHLPLSPLVTVWNRTMWRDVKQMACTCKSCNPWWLTPSSHPFLQAKKQRRGWRKALEKAM